MGKNEKLTAEHMRAFRPSRATVERINTFLRLKDKRARDYRILDWGCGRGRQVAWLIEHGFDAYGVEIDQAPIDHAREYFDARGWGDRLRVIDAAGRVPFPDESFDCLISQQVLEHVRDLPTVAAEMNRITRQGGNGFHIFPAHLRIVEGHLHMPFVHWLPKSDLRRLWIRACTRLGIEPRWPQFTQLTSAQRAQKYYEYSIQHTFYRRPADVVRTFSKSGFSARVISGYRSAADARRPLVRALSTVSRNAAANSLISTFFFVDLETEKSRACA